MVPSGTDVIHSLPPKGWHHASGLASYLPHSHHQRRSTKAVPTVSLKLNFLGKMILIPLLLLCSMVISARWYKENQCYIYYSPMPHYKDHKKNSSVSVSHEMMNRNWISTGPIVTEMQIGRTHPQQTNGNIWAYSLWCTSKVRDT